MSIWKRGVSLVKGIISENKDSIDSWRKEQALDEELARDAEAKKVERRKPPKTESIKDEVLEKESPSQTEEPSDETPVPRTI